MALPDTYKFSEMRENQLKLQRYVQTWAQFASRFRIIIDRIDETRLQDLARVLIVSMQNRIMVSIYLQDCGRGDAEKMRDNLEHHANEVKKYTHYVDELHFGSSLVDYYSIRSFFHTFKCVKTCSLFNYAGIMQDHQRHLDLTSATTVKSLEVAEDHSDFTKMEAVVRRFPNI